VGTGHKKQRRRERQAQQATALRMAEKLGLPASSGYAAAKGQRKMSEILLEFAAPLMGATDNEDAALHLSMMAWNAALFTETRRKELLDVASAGIDEKLRADLTRIMVGMIDVKLALYPEDDRFMPVARGVPIRPRTVGRIAWH
jgi:hypothetical protein